MSLAEILQKYLNQGFTLETLEIICDIPRNELKKMSLDETYQYEDMTKVTYLFLMLMQLYECYPNNQEYFKSIIMSLEQKFKIPKLAIANYLGISLKEIDDIFFDSTTIEDRCSERYMLIHLFTQMIRDPKYTIC